MSKQKQYRSMKRLILALLAVGTVATTYAQEPKSILVYGDLNLTTTRDANLNKTTQWDASPAVGYQFNRNWTLGLSISWGQNATKDSSGTKSTFNLYSVGPFARYSHYFGKSEIFFWYTQFNVAYAGGYHTSEGNPADDKHTGITMGLMPAVGINLHKALCLSFTFGNLSFADDKYQGATNASNNFNFNIAKSFGIVVSKNFGTGHKMHSHHEPGDEMNHKNSKGDDDDDAAPKPKKKERSRDDDE